MEPQMPPAAPAPQQPMPPTQNAYPQQPMQQQGSKTDVLGILSIVASVSGILALVGFIMGLIGASKAKKEGRSAILSRIGWILGLLGTVGGIIVLVLIFLAASTMGSTNKKFLNAVFAKDYDTACEMWGASTGADRESCEEIIDQVNSIYTGYEVNDVEVLNDTTTLSVTYFAVSGDDDTGTVVARDGGITNFTYGGGQNIGLLEDDPEDQTMLSGSEESLACLAQTDVEAVFPYATTWELETASDDEDVYYLDNIFFNPDATTYEFASTTETKLDDVAQLYKDNMSKAFTVNIRGQVKEATVTAEGSALATDRFEAVRDELISRGVPSSAIVQEPSKSNQFGNDAERNVEILAVTNCVSAASSTSGR